jgi:hypothetical protein
MKLYRDSIYLLKTLKPFPKNTQSDSSWLKENGPGGETDNNTKTVKTGPYIYNYTGGTNWNLK